MCEYGYCKSPCKAMQSVDLWLSYRSGRQLGKLKKRVLRVRRGTLRQLAV